MAFALALAVPAGAHPSRGIVVARDGTVYFSDLVKIRAIGPDGKMRLLRTNAEGHTHALALASDGAVWGDQSTYDPADGGYREAIWRMRPDGSLTYRYGPRKSIERGVGLLRDRRGCSWHADQATAGGAMVVHRKCPGRAAELMYGDAASDRAFRPVLVNDLAGTALSADGAFVFRDRGTIRRIAPSGALQVVARGLADDNFGIAAGPAGSLFIAEHRNRRVLRVAADGARLVAAVATAPWAPTGVAWRAERLYVLEVSDYRRDKPGQVRVRRIEPGGVARILATVKLPPA